MHFNKITIYIYFAIKLCFLKEKLPPTSDIDNMPQIMNETINYIATSFDAD